MPNGSREALAIQIQSVTAALEAITLEYPSDLFPHFAFVAAAVAALDDTDLPLSRWNQVATAKAIAFQEQMRTRTGELPDGFLSEQFASELHVDYSLVVDSFRCASEAQRTHSIEAAEAMIVSLRVASKRKPFKP